MRCYVMLDVIQNINQFQSVDYSYLSYKTCVFLLLARTFPSFCWKRVFFGKINHTTQPIESWDNKKKNVLVRNNRFSERTKLPLIDCRRCQDVTNLWWRIITETCCADVTSRGVSLNSLIDSNAVKICVFLLLARKFPSFGWKIKKFPKYIIQHNPLKANIKRRCIHLLVRNNQFYTVVLVCEGHAHI